MTGAPDMAPEELLKYELYSITEAARFLRVPASTLKNWLEGTSKYGPVIRPEPTGRTDVTWAEFVEAWMLREYRLRDVPLQRIRPFVAELRQKLGKAYPLAHFQPLVDEGSRELVLRVQQRFPDEQDLYLLRPQYVRQYGRAGRHKGPTEPAWQQEWWTPTARSYLKRVEFEGAFAVRLRPAEFLPVLIEPRVAFGIPHVQGIRTETLREAYLTGESPERIAKSWGLPLEYVEGALTYEDAYAKAA